MREAIIRVAADGSAGSRRAFEWAVDEAVRRGSAVELVSVYPPDEGGSDDGRSAAEAAVHQTMDDTVATRRVLPAISWHVVAGDPGDVLTRESEHSELLVLGSHGISGLRHSALGSVADLCARMALCPVVVVPPGAAPTRHDAIAPTEMGA